MLHIKQRYEGGYLAQGGVGELVDSADLDRPWNEIERVAVTWRINRG